MGNAGILGENNEDLNVTVESAFCFGVPARNIDTVADTRIKHSATIHDACKIRRKVVCVVGGTFPLYVDLLCLWLICIVDTGIQWIS